MITTSQIEKCGSSGSSVLGQEGGLRIMNRPLCSRRQVRQGKSFGKQGKSCFPKNCRSLPGDKHNALRGAFWLAHFSDRRQENSSWRSPCPDPALTCFQGNTSCRYLLQGECRGAVHFSLSTLEPEDPQMSRVQKLQAMEALWSDLSRSDFELESPDWHADVLRETEARFSSGDESILDWEDAKRVLRKRFE